MDAKTREEVREIINRLVVTKQVRIKDILEVMGEVCHDIGHYEARQESTRAAAHLWRKTGVRLEDLSRDIDF